MKNTVGSSIICMDHINFQDHVKLVEALGVDYLHLDVMDGSYVPRFGIYPEIVTSISEITPMRMDLHLMVADPEFALSQFSGIENIEYVSIHLNRVQTNLLKLFDLIKSQNRKPVIVVDLTSNLREIATYIRNDFVSGVMFMGIHPGVLKQRARPEIVLQNLLELQEFCDLSDLFIQCDGGVTFDTLASLKNGGINNFVCGSSTLYKNCDFRLPREEVFALINRNYKTIREKLND